MGRTTRNLLVVLAAFCTISAGVHAQQSSSAPSSGSARVGVQGGGDNGRAVVHDTAVPLLTADVLRAMTVFWGEFSKEPASIRDTAREANQEQILVPSDGIADILEQVIRTAQTDPTAQNDSDDMATTADIKESLPTMRAGIPLMAVNMTAMAAKFPSVAAAFRKARLTPQAWERYRLALFAALFLDEVDRAMESILASGGVPPLTPSQSVTWQNVTVLRTHAQDMAALKASGMWFPTQGLAQSLRAIVSPAGNLQP